MRLTFVSGNLSCGGAERVLALLAGALAGRGHEVTVVTLSIKEPDFFELALKVNRVAMDLIADVRSPSFLLRANTTVRRLRALRQAILNTEPDVVISSLQHINVLTLLALAGTRRPVVVSEHNNPRMHSCGRPWDELRRLTYPQAARLVSVSRGVSEEFSWLPQARRVVLYNPLPVIDAQGEVTEFDAGFSNETNWVAAMGRLCHQKGFDLLLPAFAAAAEVNPGWRLMILGEGPQRPELENMVNVLGLEDRVVLMGNVKHPFPLLQHAKLFVLPSRFEGFGNALAEAMACGLPVVAADCPSGPSEIVRDGQDGILVPPEDVPALTAALMRLMALETERRRLAVSGVESVKRFSIENVTGAWEKMFHEIVRGRKRPRATARERANRAAV